VRATDQTGIGCQLEAVPVAAGVSACQVWRTVQSPTGRDTCHYR